MGGVGRTFVCLCFAIYHLRIATDYIDYVKNISIKNTLFVTFFTFLKHYRFALLWAAVIAFLSLTASKNLPRLDWTLFAPDKIGHFTVYAVLAMLLLYGKTKAQISLQNQTYIYMCILAAGYGFLMEWSQYLLTPDRCFEYPDMAANAFGALLGAMTFYFSKKRWAIK
jgi:VanZ family protein